jgi:hypothetical protein
MQVSAQVLVLFNQDADKQHWTAQLQLVSSDGKVLFDLPAEQVADGDQVALGPITLEVQPLFKAEHQHHGKAPPPAASHQPQPASSTPVKAGATPVKAGQK